MDQQSVIDTNLTLKDLDAKQTPCLFGCGMESNMAPRALLTWTQFNMLHF